MPGEPSDAKRKTDTNKFNFDAVCLPLTQRLKMSEPNGICFGTPYECPSFRRMPESRRVTLDRGMRRDDSIIGPAINDI